ncbi:Uncharacterized protein TCAP_01009 [Tolypocladium capitatum]|uniref:Heparan-alpha-glucosaminide N-acetyltransferase catalytic domain-containing protein n=1 Tax=Tolypocladium capitatum TaxID=45235 RepID=A0A2K3QNF2_9HYPO|nr:Uncharacterized protein TCAP_01009 [Tolypocladium capitatum]
MIRSQKPGASAQTPTPTTRDGDDVVQVEVEVDAHDAINGTATPETRGGPTANGYRYDSIPVCDRAADVEAPSSTSATKPSGARALAPDLLRGLLAMVMALDHTAVALQTWQHGTNRNTEADGVPVRRFNFATAYLVRTLTHLCGAGFTFLLGLGVVYLGRSRTTKLGWSPLRLARYFAVRALVLTAVTAVFGFAVTGGRVWFLNMVLFALAVDYFLAGLLWLAFDKTEGLLAEQLTKVLKRSDVTAVDDGEVRPLLGRRGAGESGAASRAASLSWHIHNAVLLALSIVTIFWNIWLSENHGHCEASSSSTLPTWMQQRTVSAPQNPFARIWFWPVMGRRVVSGFPPMAWLSFAVLGLLFGRIAVARTWNPRTLAAGQAFAGVLFALVFALTRVLRFGNLSEGCLQTPEHERHPGANPYLVSPASFFYVVKYPPDVAFWAMTMAGNLFLLALFGAIPIRIAKRFTVFLDFGTTALFFYVAHLLLVFLLARILIGLFGHDTGVADPMNPDDSWGIDNLFGYFGTWALVMFILWPICRLYSRFKSGKPMDSIWRFF